MLTVRAFNDEDLQLVLRLKEQAAWNQTPSDLARFRKLSPEGSFAAEWSGEPVGCVMAFEFGQIAWIAMMLVEEAFRGRGIGRALMDRALDHLDARGIATVRLDATALGEPLYAKLGFVPQWQVGRYAGSPSVPEHASATEAPTFGVLLPACEEHIEEMIDLDQAVTHTDRRSLLLALFEEQPAELRVMIHERRVTGYVTSRPGAIARQIGPCMGDAEGGPRLLADALSRHAGSTCYIDVPLENLAVGQLLAAHGLAVQRTLTRMCRGVPVQEDLERFFASSSPEKG